MIVELSESLFRDEPCDLMDLVSLFRLGREGRARLVSHPAFRSNGDTPLNRWLEAQGQLLRDGVVAAMKLGLRAANKFGRSEPRVVVEKRDEPLWPASLADVPRLPLNDRTLKFLADPLRLLLENDVNDWGFLVTVVPRTFRGWFEQARSKGLLEPDHGGGSDMVGTLETHVLPNHVRRLRTWALFDSDAARRDEPSDAAKRLAKLCERLAGYHMLWRRNIESYIPRAVMERWVETIENTKRKERSAKAMKNLWELAPEERRYRSISKELKKAGGRDIKNDKIWHDRKKYGMTPELASAEDCENEFPVIFQSIYSSL